MAISYYLFAVVILICRQLQAKSVFSSNKPNTWQEYNYLKTK